MNENRPEMPQAQDFDVADARIRDLIFTIALVVGIVATFYFGMADILHGKVRPAVMSFAVIGILLLMLLINALFQRIKRITNVVFTYLLGAGFLLLVHTKFPVPSVSLWAFIYPLVAVFVIDRRPALFVLVLFNLCLAGLFAADIHFFPEKHSFEYAFRFGGVMIVISLLSYYYQTLRDRSMVFLRSLNDSLEQRVEQSRRDLEATQERLSQSEKMEAIGRLAGGIAHDFNNQLTGIMAFADLARIAAKEGGEMHDYAANILLCAERSSKLTHQLLAFARKSPMRSVPVDLDKVIKNVVSLLSHTIDKRITINHEPAQVPPTVLGDPDRLENALLNLALNGADAMPEGGTLVLATALADLDEAMCAAMPGPLKPGRYVRVNVTDTGCGMTRDLMNRIFDPFFTTKIQGKGTGMGLPAAYGTVQSLDGAITVASEPGRGSLFSVYLPYVAAAAEERVVTPAPFTAGRREGHILIVDDEPGVCRSVNALLQSLGYTVTMRDNGKDGLEYYRENWSTITLVILDMVMPDMGGRDVFMAMKKINPRIKALLATGYSIDATIKEIMDAGFRGYLQKPFLLKDLQEKIDAALEG
ncbi:MAG: response regulator [Chitinispirillaceae bacterium]|nr:response regulator [Chitinispirillaceae bacterium]